MFPFFLLAAGALTVAPLTNVTIWIDVPQPISMPNGCVPDCQDKCWRCTLATLPDCSFTDVSESTGIVGFYATRPDIACQRDRLYIYNPGRYRLTINQIGKNIEFVPFRFDDNTKVFVSFVLGYHIKM